MSGIITIDIGTTSLRSIVFDAEGRAWPADQRTNMPSYYPDGRVEQDTEAWLRLLPAVLKSAAECASARGIIVSGISLTAQRSSLIPVDAEGRALRPAIMWQDQRSSELAASMAGNERLVFERTGLRISPVFSAIKMLWLRRNEAELFARTRRLIGIQDFVVHMLTGRYVTDHSFGSRTNLFDLKSLGWSPELLSLFEVEEDMLCELIPPGSVVGGLGKATAEATGLTAGTPVISAGGDQQCAALGLGLFSAERAVTNTGTGSYLIGHSGQPWIDSEMRLSCNVSAVPGAFILEAAVLSSGSIYRWLRENLWAGGEGADAFAAMNAEAEASGPGAGGLVMLPHFKGAGSPHWDSAARGLFYNLSLSTKRGDLARAILEGIAIELSESLALVEEVCGRVGSVSVSGGLTGSGLFNQIQADVFGRPVVRYPMGEATSLGAWIAGAVATGLAAGHREAFARATAGADPERFEPDAAMGDFYGKRRQQAGGLYAALANPAFRGLFP